MKSEFVLAINEIIEARALPRETIFEALQTALVSAYRRDVSVSSAQKVDAAIDMNTGAITLLVEKEAVESVANVRTEIKLSDALQIDPDVEMGDTLMVPVSDTTRQFGRIAAQTAKQVILQKIREAERDMLYAEYSEREGDLISGTVQSISGQGVTINFGRAEALLPRAHLMPGERFKPHDKVRTLLLQVSKGTRGPQIIVSRSHRDMLKRLLEYEVPEIFNGQVEIKNIAREAGFRSKVAVAALQEGVDPVGACVGMRGIRIQNIVRELNEEKIDVIEWNPDASIFITKALSPARVSGVFLDEFADSGRGGMGTATVIVPDDQLSLAIGREGQNARLAAKLTGWRIDIKSVTEAAATPLSMEDSASIAALNEANSELVEEVTRILAKRETGRPIMPEEYQNITQYARLAEETLLEERRKVNKKHHDKIEKIRKSLPEGAFTLGISALDVPGGIARLLSSRFDSVGDLMLALKTDVPRVERAISRSPQDDALDVVKAAVESVEIPEPVVAEPEVEEVVEEPVAEEVVDEVVEAVADAEVEEAIEAEAVADAVPEALVEESVEEVPPAIIEPELEPLPEPVVPAVEVEKPKEVAPAPTYFAEPDEELDELRDKRKDSKSKSLRRQLVFDEEVGKVVAKRKRKGSRKRASYMDDIDELDMDDSI